MSLCRNFGLRNEDFIADGAVLAFRLTRFRAGRLDCCIDHFGVALGRNFFGFYCITAFTLAAAGLLALFRAGRFSRDRPGAPVVAECLAVRRTANRAGSRLRAACRCPSVSLGGNLSLRNENFIADGAVLAFRLAGFCAGRLYGCIDYFGVPLGRNFFGFNCITAFTLAAAGLLALFRAGRFGCNCPVAPIVTECFAVRRTASGAGSRFRAARRCPSVSLCRNLDLRNKNFIADGAVFAFRLARHCAGRLDCRISYFGVTICGNIHGIRRIAALALAGTSLFALRSAGRFGCNCPVAPIVAERIAVGCAANRAGFRCSAACHRPCVSLCRNFSLRNKNFVTDGAVLALRLARLHAGRFDRLVDHFRMALGRNSFLRDENLSTDGAVLALCQAWLCAGRSDRFINDFCVRLAFNRDSARLCLDRNRVQIIVNKIFTVRRNRNGIVPCSLRCLECQHHNDAVSFSRTIQAVPNNADRVVVQFSRLCHCQSCKSLTC